MSEWTPLGVEDCAEDPFAQFATWFDEAEGHMAERQAICLATSTPDNTFPASAVSVQAELGITQKETDKLSPTGVDFGY